MAASGSGLFTLLVLINLLIKHFPCGTLHYWVMFGVAIFDKRPPIWLETPLRDPVPNDPPPPRSSRQLRPNAFAQRPSVRTVI